MIRIKDLAYTYPQKNAGIGPLSFSVRPGEILHGAGSSGCGKSTLARCIAGIIPHIYHGTMSGEVTIDGHRTAATPLWKLSELAGFVFQNPSMQMLGSSVEEEIIIGLENLGLTEGEIRERLEESLERFGLADFRDRRPATLSGGEQQKLALAVMAARRPPVLVLDEPLSMLDVAAASELIDYLSELARGGVTMVVFEHRSDYLDGVPGVRVMRLDGPRKRARAGRRPGRPGRKRRIEDGRADLETTGLGVRIGGRDILKNLDLTLRRGEVTAVVGRNGVGKTTLLRAIAGLQKHEGRVSVEGRPPKVGHVFQNADLQLFNATVRSEILYRITAPDMELYAWIIDTLGLRRYEETPPLILSEGEKKRVALATVLMHDPSDGILLDEPSLGQDTAHKDMLVEICRGIADRNRIAVMTTHDLRLAAAADRLVLMGPCGGIVADGPPGDVFADDRAWRRAGLFVPAWITGMAREGITA